MQPKTPRVNSFVRKCQLPDENIKVGTWVLWQPGKQMMSDGHACTKERAIGVVVGKTWLDHIKVKIIKPLKYCTHERGEIIVTGIGELWVQQ
ncbi:hypothetical protein L6255_03185 [Candidatus Parcubacteria bacterium]|nr:hypothetical protein [Patescibacteria group bacterium]MBU4381194.1 hypothetical protein [Patescibacteria group bacterium]MCG2689416.1 hypothetical protein [Candidatus Parcubacteria bacterium]